MDTMQSTQHGNHWGAVEEDVTSYVQEMIPLIAREGTLLGKNSFRHELEGLPIKEGTVYGLKYPERSPVCFIALVVGGCYEEYHEDYRELWTAYPFCSEGVVHRMIVGGALAEPNGIEGTVEVYTEQTESIIFYDPLFFLNKDRYEPGETVDVALSGLAYFILQLEVDESEPVDPSEYYYVIINDVEDSATTEFVVQEAVPLACLGRIFWRIKGAIIRGSENTEIGIYIYASEQVLKGYEPRVGDWIRAVAWIQGWIHDTERTGPPPGETLLS